MKHAETVYVVDDDKAVRDSLRWLIESVGLPVETFGSAQEFLRRCEDDEVRGCLVADVRLPGVSGLDLQDRLRAMDIYLPTIVITGHGDVPVAVRAMKAGALDFIEKPFSDQILLDRIREAMARDEKYRELAGHCDELAARFHRLTPREREVMDLVVAGRLNKQIAAELGLSHKTIEVHRAHVMNKMRAESLAELVRIAVVLEENGVKPRVDADAAMA
jgi:FixJ family two-component response regulator